MTNQEKKAWLNRYREAEAEARRLDGEIQRWRAKATKMTVAAHLVPGGSSGGRSMENAVVEINALLLQLAEQRQETVRLRRRLEAGIAGVDDPRLRELLRRRYIDGDTWEKIAVALDVSYRWVCQLHGEALEKIFVSS